MQRLPVRMKCAAPGHLAARRSFFANQRATAAGADEYRAYAFALEQPCQVANMPLGAASKVVADKQENGPAVGLPGLLLEAPDRGAMGHFAGRPGRLSPRQSDQALAGDRAGEPDRLRNEHPLAEPVWCLNSGSSQARRVIEQIETPGHNVPPPSLVRDAPAQKNDRVAT